jgi:hypothetical protein
MVILCPEGCGEIITINLDGRSGPAWKFFQRKSGVTVYPSIWRETGCQAHFIIWNDRILWCDRNDSASTLDESLLSLVRNKLPPAGMPHKHYEEISVELGEVPWEVLWCCQRLVEQGDATSSNRGQKFGASGYVRRRSRFDFQA